jgi:cell division protein FtsB
MATKGTSTLKRPTTPQRSSDRGRSRLGDVTRPVPIDRRVARHGRSNFLLAIAALGIAGALAAALFVLPVQTYFGQNERIDQRTDQLTQLQAVVSDLRSEVERLRTEDGIREAARVELGYVDVDERRETIRELPDVPTQLPDGWPYSLVTAITNVVRHPDPAAVPTP